MPEQHSKKSEKAKTASNAAKTTIEVVKTEEITLLKKFAHKLPYPHINWARVFHFDTISTYGLAIFVCIILFVGIGIIGFDLLGNIQKRKHLREKRTSLLSQKNYWEAVIAKYNDYRDGYFKLATINYQLGNIESARINVKKALELDPNFEVGRELEKVVGQ